MYSYYGKQYRRASKKLKIKWPFDPAPGEGNGNPLQYSFLENPMDQEPGGLVHGVAESQTRLSEKHNNDPAILLLCIYIYKGSEIRVTKRDLLSQVHCSVILSSQEMKRM